MKEVGRKSGCKEGEETENNPIYNSIYNNNIFSNTFNQVNEKFSPLHV